MKLQRGKVSDRGEAVSAEIAGSGQERTWARWKNLAAVGVGVLLTSCGANYANYPLPENINSQLSVWCQDDRTCHMQKLTILANCRITDPKVAEQALSTLSAALNDPDKAVRTAAVKGLTDVASAFCFSDQNASQDANVKLKIKEKAQDFLKSAMEDGRIDIDQTQEILDTLQKNGRVSAQWAAEVMAISLENGLKGTAPSSRHTDLLSAIAKNEKTDPQMQQKIVQLSEKLLVSQVKESRRLAINVLDSIIRCDSTQLSLKDRAATILWAGQILEPDEEIKKWAGGILAQIPADYLSKGKPEISVETLIAIQTHVGYSGFAKSLTDNTIWSYICPYVKGQISAFLVEKLLASNGNDYMSNNELEAVLKLPSTDSSSRAKMVDTAEKSLSGNRKPPHWAAIRVLELVAEDERTDQQLTDRVIRTLENLGEESTIWRIALTKQASYGLRKSMIKKYGDALMSGDVNRNIQKDIESRQKQVTSYLEGAARFEKVEPELKELAIRLLARALNNQSESARTKAADALKFIASPETKEAGDGCKGRGSWKDIQKCADAIAPPHLRRLARALFIQSRWVQKVYILATLEAERQERERFEAFKRNCLSKNDGGCGPSHGPSYMSYPSSAAPIIR